MKEFLKLLWLTTVREPRGALLRLAQLLTEVSE